MTLGVHSHYNHDFHYILHDTPAFQIIIYFTFFLSQIFLIAFNTNI